MTFRSFAVHLRRLLHLLHPLFPQIHAGHALLFQIALLLCALSLLPSGAFGAPTNTTLRLDSASFTHGWHEAQFPPTGENFAFTDAPDEQLLISLPPNTSEVFYQGFTASGGSRFFACVDCDPSDESGGSHLVEVDAHDQAQDGQQLPRTLFSFVGLDTTTNHILTVKNLQDDRFGNTSQLTFDSLIVTLGEADGESSTATTVSTITVTATSTDTVVATSTDTVTATSTDSQGASSTPTTATTDSGNPTSINSPSSTSTDTTTDTSPTTSSTPTDPPPSSSSTQSQDTTPTGSPGTSSTSSSPSTSSGNGSGTGGSVPTPAPIGTNTSAPASSPTDSGSDQSPSTSPGDPSPSTSPGDPSPSTSPGDPNSSHDDSQPSNGVSKPVIIVVAVVASLVVLALLAAIVWLLMRSQPSPGARDPESGGGGLAQGGAPMAFVPRPSPTPPRPTNPFVDTVPATTPIEPSLESPDVMTQPQPRTVLPPPLPPKSPLRATYSGTGRAPWLTRPVAQRTPSPASPIE